MPPKKPPTPKVEEPVQAEPVEEVNAWPPEEIRQKRAENSEKWLLEAVDLKKEAKLTREREAAEAIARAQWEKEQAAALKELEEAEIKALRQVEVDVKEAADAGLGEWQSKRDREHGRACWPLRPKPVYLSYAKDSKWHEREFLSTLVMHLNLGRGLKNSVWVDMEEGVQGSPYTIVDRCAALNACKVAVLVLSQEYLTCPQAQLEVKVMRSRIVGGFGTPLKLLLVKFQQDLVLSEDLQAITTMGHEHVQFVSSEHPDKSLDDTVRFPQGIMNQVPNLALNIDTAIGDAVPKRGERQLPQTDPVAADDDETGEEMKMSAEEHKITSAYLTEYADRWMHSQKGIFLEKRTVEWNTHDVVAWVQSHGKSIAHYAPVFLKKKVDGFRLEVITEDLLVSEFGMIKPAIRDKFWRILSQQIAKDAAIHWGPQLTTLSHSELHQFIVDMFLSADEDRNGTLDRRELKKMFECSTYLALSPDELQRILVEADEDDDGTISYTEFVPLMVNLVQMMKSKEGLERARLQEEGDTVGSQEAAKLVKGMTREELETTLLEVFVEADQHETGRLTRKAFKKCLRKNTIGLSRKELNALMSKANEDELGNIEYREFLPLVFGTLMSLFREDIQKGVKGADSVRSMLLAKYEAMDPDGTEKLVRSQLRQGLQQISVERLGFSEMQILMLLAESAPDKKGRCNYVHFTDIIAPIIWNIFDTSTQVDREMAILNLAKIEGLNQLRTVRGFTCEDVKATLLEAFQQVDEDGTGLISQDQMEKVLKCLGASALQLSTFEVNALMVSVDTNLDGKIQYREFVDFMFNVLAHLDREAKVHQHMLSL